MKFHLILAILCCSVLNNCVALPDLSNVVSYIPTSVTNQLITYGANVAFPGSGAALNAAKDAYGAYSQPNGSFSSAAVAGAKSGLNSLSPVVGLATGGMEFIQDIYEGKTVSESAMKLGQKALEAQMGKEKAALVSKGLNCANRFMTKNESALDIAKDLGKEAFEAYVPQGEAILTAAQVANDIKNGKDVSEVIKDVGTEKFKKYVPNGEEVFTAIQVADAVRKGDPPEKILDDLGKDAITKYIPNGNQIVEAIQVGQAIKNGKTDEVIKKYGEGAIEKYGGNNPMVKGLMNQAVKTLPNIVTNLLPKKEPKTKPTGSGTTSKSTASKVTPSKLAASKVTPSKPTAGKGSTVKPTISSRSPLKDKTNSNISTSREDVVIQSKKKCWISHPLQKRKEEEERKKKGFMSRIGLKK
ncbi:uncharacterized protein LOC116339737 isoform X2 [Contarinia nasturtii]|uniref:uncharacterized protein LOC116339737 isoform X2 n=1 Tax=Contarinia nasturtii TaxID=265458 RepID=UPI0012D44402|nr:uncharacterized protein LOC116339737 isoform X2 [Contarinia nasturtii]